MGRLTYWNNKEKGSALPLAIDDAGNTYDLETICAKLAEYEDAEEHANVEPSETMNFVQGLECIRLLVVLEAMKAENKNRELNDEALVYEEQQFIDFSSEIQKMQKEWIDGMKKHYKRMNESRRRRM